MSDIRLHLSEQGQLLVDPDDLAEATRPGLSSGPLGSHVARKAKLTLHAGIRREGLLALEDVPAFLAAVRQADAEAADTRSRYQKYLDRRREARRQRALDEAAREVQRELQEDLAKQRGLHGDFLDQKAKREALERQNAERFPDAPNLDLDLHSWESAGAPEEVPVLRPRNTTVKVVEDDEGDII